MSEPKSGRPAYPHRHSALPPRYGLFDARGAVLIILAMIAMGWVMSRQKSDRTAHLLSTGITVAGTITEVATSKAETTGARVMTFVTYTFRDEAGTEHGGGFRHYGSDPLDLKAGGTILVLYDPKEPSNHAPRDYLGAKLNPIRR